MKLISMTDFVISQWDKDIMREEFAQSMINYATFLKQPLKLEMFVPCDDDGSVLKKPHLGMFHDNRNPIDDFNSAETNYKKAKEKVLFEGFEAKNYLNLVGLKHKAWDSWCMGCYKTVEDLSVCKNIFITESAIKQIQP